MNQQPPLFYKMLRISIAFLYFLILLNNSNVYSQQTWSEKQNNNQLLLDNYREQLYQITRYNVINEIYSNTPSDPVRHDILLTLQDLKENNKQSIPHAKQIIESYIGHPDITYLAYELGNIFFLDEDYEKSEFYYSQVEIKLLRKRERYNIWFKRGYTALILKKYSDATESFSKIDNPYSHYYISAIYYNAFAKSKLGEYDEALSLLFSIDGNEEFGSEIPIIISKIYLKRRDFNSLVKYVEKIPQKYMQDEELLLLIGEAFFHVNKFEKASQYYKKIKSVYTNDHDLSFRIGYSYYTINEFKNALPYFKRVINNDGINTSYLIQSKFYAGIISAYLKNYKESLDYFNYVIDNEDDNFGILQRAIYMKVLNLYNIKSYDLAAKTYLSFINDYPRIQNIDRENGIFNKIIRRIDDQYLALEFINRVNDILQKQNQPLFVNLKQEVMNNLGRISLEKGDYENAYGNYIQTVKYNKSPNTVLAHIGLAETLFLFKRFKAAQTYYQYALDNFNLLDQGKYLNNNIWINLNYSMGYSYFNQRLYKKSLSFFLETINQINGKKLDKQMKKTKVDVQLRLADCYYASKDYIKAREYYLVALDSKYSKKAYVNYQLANIEAARENFDKAVSYYEKVLASTENEDIKQKATFGLAKYYFQQTKYDEAIVFFNKYIKKCENSNDKAKALLLRGIAYDNKWDIANAEASFEEIIESHLETNYVEGAFNALRSLYIKQNKNNELEQLTKVYKTVNTDEESLKYIDYQTAMEYVNNKKYEKTIEMLTTFLDNNPETPLITELNKTLSEAYLGINDTNNAIKYFEKRDDVNNYKNQIKIALLYQNKHSFKESNAWLSKVLKRDSTSLDIKIKCYKGMLKNFTELKNYKEMQPILGNLYAITQDKESLLPYSLVLSKHFLDIKKYAKLKKNTDLIISLDKNDIGANAYYLQVKSLFKQEKYDICIQKVKEFGNQFESSEYWIGKAYIIMAECFLKKENKPQAIGILESIVENIDSKDVKAEAQIKLDELRPPVKEVKK